MPGWKRLSGIEFLDTSVVVGYLMKTPPDQASRAVEIIESASALTITSVCLTEAYFALSTRYRVPRDQIIYYLTALVLKDNITPCAVDQDLLIQGLEMCRGSTRVSIGDALIWAQARTAGAQAIYSFDRRFPSDGLEIRG